jgi:hypothetical protein
LQECFCSKKIKLLQATLYPALGGLWGIEEGMGVVKIQIASAMEAEEMWSGDQGFGFFVEDHIKHTEQCRVKIRITIVEKSLEVGITVAELWPYIKPVLCFSHCRILILR